MHGSKLNADAISTNATNIAANDYFDQTGVKLAAGTGETWTELETAVGTFTTGVSAGTLTIAAGSITDSNGAVNFGDENLSTTGTLSAGATTLGSTLDVTGSGEFDSSLGADWKPPRGYFRLIQVHGGCHYGCRFHFR